MKLALMINHLYLVGSIVLVVYSQSIIRWRLNVGMAAPEGLYPKMKFLLAFLLEPWVLSAVVATFFSGVLWILALTKFELSYAYPWMAMVFLLMLLVGVALFGENMSVAKLVGTTLVVVGLVVVARG